MRRGQALHSLTIGGYAAVMNASPAVDFSWDALPDRYRVILCDVWGVIHDGVRVYPGAAARLCRWRDEGRFVILLTNAPRTADSVAGQLDRIGLPRVCWDTIVTGGEAGIEALSALTRPVGFLGTDDDRAVLEGRGVRISDGEEFSDLGCTGLEEDRSVVEQYGPELAARAGRGVRFHCLNPDRVVLRGGRLEACAGALADLYEELGGSVVWYGKPHRAIYDHALRVAGNSPLDQVLAIGDGLQTDMLGAARLGIDAVFVRDGIHAGEPFPAGFARTYELGDWRPIACADGLD
jgi:HAD superfamily hydrolase (TIGR01459 family)